MAKRNVIVLTVIIMRAVPVDVRHTACIISVQPKGWISGAWQHLKDPGTILFHLLALFGPDDSLFVRTLQMFQILFPFNGQQVLLFVITAFACRNNIAF